MDELLTMRVLGDLGCILCVPAWRPILSHPVLGILRHTCLQCLDKGFELSGAAGLSLPLLAANRGDHEIALQFLGAEGQLPIEDLVWEFGAFWIFWELLSEWMWSPSGLNSTLIQSAQFAELTFQALLSVERFVMLRAFKRPTHRPSSALRVPTQVRPTPIA